MLSPTMIWLSGNFPETAGTPPVEIPLRVT